MNELSGVTDLSCTCSILHVPRSTEFDVTAMFANLDATNFARVLRTASGVNWFGLGEENDVIGCTTTKDVESPAGVFSIQLKPRREYMKMVSPGDLVFIFMSDVAPHQAEDFTGTPVMIGVVDRVDQTVALDNNAETRVVQVSGRDLTVVFLETSTVFDQSFSQIENALYTGALQHELHARKRDFLSPTENILTMLSLFYDFDATKSNRLRGEPPARGRV